MIFSDCKQFMPHDDVYVRLGVSKIHGVGVFAIRHIKKGTDPFMHDNNQIVWIKDEEVQKLKEDNQELYKFYEDFCVFKDGYWGAPPNFNQLTSSWFLNNSEDPNMQCDGEDYIFFAKRDIEKGEELTADYSTYSEDYQ